MIPGRQRPQPAAQAASADPLPAARPSARRSHCRAPAAHSAAAAPLSTAPFRPSASGPPMLLATRRASQLFHSLFPVPRMGDSASKIVSPQEALPGRKEPIPVAGKDSGTRRRHGLRRCACASAPCGCASSALPEESGGPASGGLARLGSAQARRGFARGGGAEGSSVLFLCLASHSLKQHV